MTSVAKLILIDDQDMYLMLERSEHPRFSNDPDLPGGTVEEGESTLDALVREVQEEIGVDINVSSVHELYSGVDYSAHGTHYALFLAKLDHRPELSLSWEHAGYQWISREEFLALSRSAQDTYMHMVHDVLAAKS